VNVTQWHGCYNDSWQGVITPDAFAHPAKYARGLIRRIYQHMLDSGYVARGDSIIDPFGGVALGGLDAMTFGLHWTGCELEPRFVELGQRNIDKWRRDLAMLNGTLGTARLLQGDSRRLLEVVGGGMGAAVSSPPYDTEQMGGGGSNAGLSSNQIAMKAGYGSTPGQLGSMPSGDYGAAVSSPPYADNAATWVEGPGARHDPIHHNGDNAHKISSDNGYGTTPGNVGNMRDGGFEGVVSSPPFESSDMRKGGSDLLVQQAIRRGRDPNKPGTISNTTLLPYGSDPANIGNDSGDNFWTAARAIVEQTYAALRPGGYAAWVTKRFVRNKQIVEFSEQWAQLCEAVGFERVEWIRAMLTEEHGHQLDIFGDSHPKGIKRASFFRRLYEKKYPENAIDWEDVIILRKPL
jgi:hypothetical protein